jgi:Uma2 family endonuclease
MAVASFPKSKQESTQFTVQLGPVLELDEGIVFRLDPTVNLDDDELFEFCQINRDLRIERDEQGEITIMAPAGGETGSRNAAITAQLYNWTQRDGTGISFDSSVGFRLGGKAMLSPDAAWIQRERFQTLAPRARQEFPPICPDFVIELRSNTDRLGTLREKMDRWLKYGAKLGWLIDPMTKRVYRAAAQVEIIDDATSISADPVLPGFSLDLTQIW